MTDYTTAVRDAVMALDPGNDDHWTKTGLPDLDAVSALHGDKVTRADITTAVGGLDRDQLMKAKYAAPVASVSDAAASISAEPPVSDDPVMLIERFCAAVNQPRFKRNRVFQQIRQMWSNEQTEGRDIQRRLDDRNTRIIERNAMPEDLKHSLAEQAKAEKQAAEDEKAAAQAAG